MSRPDLSGHPAVSFTVKRPSPLSRDSSEGDVASSNTFKPPATRNVTSAVSTPSPLATSTVKKSGTGTRGAPSKRTNNTGYDGDSSDEEGGTEDELITGFDALGAQRVKELPKSSGPLVIPAEANRDWRAAARKRATQQTFVPDSGKAAAMIGPDGSVGGLGTRDTINSGPQVIGLITKKRRVLVDGETAGDVPEDAEDVEMTEGTGQFVEETLTEDERALRALLSQNDEKADEIDAIPLTASTFQPMTETDVYREDVLTRPDSSSLEDYARVPIDQFGAALLRGMGWKEGMAASKTRKGLAEPYLPSTRPALLGLGAKEQVVEESSDSKKKKFQRPEKRYTPVVKRARDGTIITDDPGSSGRSSPAQTPSGSRRASRSPPRRDSDRERGVEGRDGRHRSHRDYPSDRDRGSDREGDRYADKRRDRIRETDRYRESDRRRDDERERERDRRRDEDRRANDDQRERSERNRGDDKHNSSRNRDGDYRR